jgi:alpha-N-arabinofuranosidase
MKTSISIVLLILLSASALAETHVVVSAHSPHAVDHRIFGVMMERADWSGEGGAENAWLPGIGWRTGIVPLWDKLGATMVRFPGGGLADRYDWRWGVDNVPGRDGPRPKTERADTMDGSKVVPSDTEGGTGIETHFVGTDEAAAMCRRVGAQLSIVVNLLWFKDDYERGAKFAADWVEYCNAPNDGRNPNGGVDWAAIRAKNGHAAPYNVHLWEIGNEVWLLPYPQETYGKQVAVYADAMRKVDPSIEIIADGQSPELRDSVAKYAGKRVQFIAFHHYEPWEAELRPLTAAQTYAAAASLPSDPWRDWLQRMGAFVRDTHMGYKLALTEWNIHGWRAKAAWDPRAWDSTKPKYVPFSVSMASWFNDLIRHSDLIPIADVSMLLGTEWANTLIRYSWDADRTALPFLSYQIMSLYAHNTGDRLLETTVTGVETYRPPSTFGDSRLPAEMPYLDITATEDAAAVYLHVVNRDPSRGRPVTFDLSAFPALREAKGTATWVWEATAMSEPFWQSPGAASQRTAPVRAHAGVLRFEAPPHTATILRLPLAAS